MPGARIAQCLSLPLRQHGRCLDEVQVERRGEGGRAFAARRRSAISVPRPGPISMSRTLAGRPIASQAEAAQTPISSPKIWLISGAVTKSPAAPKGSRVM